LQKELLFDILTSGKLKREGFIVSYPTDFFDTATFDETFKYVLLIYGAIFLVILVFAFISYLFKGIGMYGMAKRLGVSDPWLAFIPIASNFLQGELAKPFAIGKKQIKTPGVWTLVYPFIFGAVFSCSILR
jgi:hypothetical protein